MAPTFWAPWKIGHRIVMTTVQPADTAPPIGTTVRIGFRRLGDVAIPAIDILEDQ